MNPIDLTIATIAILSDEPLPNVDTDALMCAYCWTLGIREGEG